MSKIVKPEARKAGTYNVLKLDHIEVGTILFFQLGQDFKKLFKENWLNPKLYYPNHLFRIFQPYLIRMLDGGSYSHAALYVGNGDIIHATSRNNIGYAKLKELLKSRSPTPEKPFPPTVLIADAFEHTACSRQDIKKVVEFAEKQVDDRRQYSIYAIVLLIPILLLRGKFLLNLIAKMLMCYVDRKDDRERDEPQATCSEFIHRCFLEACDIEIIDRSKNDVSIDDDDDNEESVYWILDDGKLQYQTLSSKESANRLAKIQAQFAGDEVDYDLGILAKSVYTTPTDLECSPTLNPVGTIRFRTESKNLAS